MDFSYTPLFWNLQSPDASTSSKLILYLKFCYCLYRATILSKRIHIVSEITFPFTHSHTVSFLPAVVSINIPHILA